MSPETNKTVIRRFVKEVINGGNLNVVADALGMLQQLGVIPPMGPPPQS